jgi:hypothetical protein
MQDGKFHPHTDYKKGIRKSRDQQAKTQGVKVRKARDSLSDREVERLGELGNIIQSSLSCDVTGAGFPCRTDRLEAVRAMEEYLAIHNIGMMSVTRMKRNRQEVKNLKYDIQFFEDTITNQEDEDTNGFQGSIGKGNKMITAEVYPVNPNDPSEGWEYRLHGDIEKLGSDYDGRYDSYLESWTGNPNDHASSSDKAMEWAENTAIDFLEGN